PGPRAARRVVLLKAPPPGEAGVGGGKTNGPDGGPRAAENLLGFCRSWIPNVDLMIVPASGGGQTPVGAEGGGEDDAVVLGVALDGAIAGNFPDVLWTRGAGIAAATRR